MNFSSNARHVFVIFCNPQRVSNQILIEVMIKEVFPGIKHSLIAMRFYSARKSIIKINKLNDTRYEIYTGISKLEKHEALEVYKVIRQMCLCSKDYIIQRGIPLAMIDDCFIDVRVMTQKIDGVWQVTGKAVKVAGRLFFVTNAARTILTLEEALQQTTVPSMRQQKLDADIDALCLAALKELRHHTSITIVGFDVGITAQGEVWIIEGNYVPDISLFKQLEDKTMYETIVKNRLLVKQPSE